MIKKWNQFIREFVNNPDSLIDAKMQELKDLVDSVSDGQNMVYEWENKKDHQLSVSFSTGELSIKYEFDIDDLYITKTAGDVIDFQTNVESMDEGLDMIEKDIQGILGISESSEYSSSIKEHEVENVIKRILDFSKIGAMDNSADTEGIVEDMEKSLSSFDKETIDLVIDTILFGDDSESWKEWISKEIIRVGDKVMSKYGTEPMQVLNAYDTAFNYLKRNFNWKEDEEEVSEKKMNESSEIMLGDNKIHEIKEGDQLRFMEHYKNHLIKKYSSSFTDEINLDEPVTFIKIESSNLIRPNLIVRTKEGVEWVFGPEAFVLDRL
jgi:hypothetical protein